MIGVQARCTVTVVLNLGQVLLQLQRGSQVCKVATRALFTTETVPQRERLVRLQLEGGNPDMAAI